jgi:hypothetical protein
LSGVDLDDTDKKGTLEWRAFLFRSEDYSYAAFFDLSFAHRAR